MVLMNLFMVCRLDVASEKVHEKLGFLFQEMCPVVLLIFSVFVLIKEFVCLGQ
jgi:hypothetical protein